MTTDAKHEAEEKSGAASQISSKAVHSDGTERSFEEQVAAVEDEGVLREFLGFLRHNKKWWLLPLIGSLLLVGLLSIMGTGAAAPFIYTLF